MNLDDLDLPTQTLYRKAYAFAKRQIELRRLAFRPWTAIRYEDLLADVAKLGRFDGEAEAVKEGSGMCSRAAGRGGDQSYASSASTASISSALTSSGASNAT